jgi:myo-inositol 2-dehydrogenase / D-chiro-inositol 1-dehydrogenase
VRQVRLALAGAGWVAGVHGFAARHVDGAVISHVASRSDGRAAEAAQRMKARPCGYEELPAGADGVVVCTPPATHPEHALRAVRAGAAVLVEKPLCTTLADADVLVAAVEDGGAIIGYAENLAFAPAVRLGVAAVRELGELRHLEVRAMQPRPEWGDFLTAEWGGGVLFDLGAHPLAVALLLAAPAVPVRVRADLSGGDDHPVDEHAEVELTFDSGMRATVVASWRGPQDAQWDAQVASADGVVRVVLLPEVLLERDGEGVELPAVPDGVFPQLDQLGYLPQLRSFAEDLAAARQPAVGPAFGRSVLDVTAAAYASAASGTEVSLPFAGARDRSPHQLWTE